MAPPPCWKNGIDRGEGTLAKCSITMSMASSLISRRKRAFS
jgi:hypothetical protein